MERISDPPSARSSHFSLLEKEIDDVSVYLDYNATTPMQHEVYMTVIHALKYNWANPSSAYQEGKQASQIIEKARQRVATMLGASPSEIIFTSGGTEANNQIIYSIIQEYKSSEFIPNVIASNVEHDCIRKTLEHYVQQDQISVTYINVSHTTGQVDCEEIKSAILPNTCLITIMAANNETGVIQPLEKIAEVVKEVNQSRTSDMALSPRIYFHSDLAQAIGKIPINVEQLGIDYGAIAGHKFYGPRIGALFFKEGCPLYPLLHGGGQECGLRSGTENTGLIAGLGKAANLVTHNLAVFQQHFTFLKNYLREKLKEVLKEEVVFHEDRFSGEVLPNTCSIGFQDSRLTGSLVLSHCRSLRASTGSACHSSLGRPSPTLSSFGIPEDLALRSIRLSIGRETTPDKIDIAVYDLLDAIRIIKKEGGTSSQCVNKSE